ncbi:MAG TPA: glycoside hydrolase family 25 protein [Candidatus Corynebacterium avicola]|uniref:Glycoside hydrolase family 25 protein n=1 Tax=Candidatus Corynebacterium avicola TaxID=2838527 RepID=A0A9D1UMK5_9CORY|nr:glycoside hydrolase family 25 protein [Candidatus Corynebacterium avicola]
MFSLRWRRHALTTPARLTAVTLFGSAATVAALVATDVVPVPSWALDGVDVASHQHPDDGAIDWQTVAASGQSFAFIKASEGTGYVNPYFTSDSAKASAAGVTPGSYHFAKPGTSDPRAEAQHYAATLASGAQPSLPPTLDLEESGGLGPEELQNWVRDWIDEIKILTGRDPIIYTYNDFWINDMGNTEEFSEYPLWLAYYNPTLPSEIPGGWDEVTFWQYSDAGQVDGIYADVDLNTYYGTDAQLQELAGQPSAGSAVGNIADALRPITDAARAQAEAANNTEHEEANGEPGLNQPLSTDLLVNLLGLVAGTVGPEAVLESALGSGLDETLGSALTSSGMEARDAGETLPLGAVAALVLGSLGLGTDGGDIASQIGSLAGSLPEEQSADIDGGSGFDINALTGIIGDALGGGEGVTLDSILRLMSAFGADNYAAQIAGGTVDKDALLDRIDAESGEGAANKAGEGEDAAPAEAPADADAAAPAPAADPEAIRTTLEDAGVDPESAARLAEDPDATVAAAERLGVDRETASHFATDPEAALKALEEAGIDPVSAAPMLVAQL